MIPKFDDNRINFVRFIKENKYIFDKLLKSKGNNSSKYSVDGYYFFRNFRLGDDADVYELTSDLDEFNIEGQPPTEKIINAFERWLQIDIVKKEFEKEYKKKIQREEEKIKKLNRNPLNQIEERGVKRRTIKRTAKIIEELSAIDYVPEDRQNSVKGKTYRELRDAFKKINKPGGNKQKI